MTTSARLSIYIFAVLILSVNSLSKYDQLKKDYKEQGFEEVSSKLSEAHFKKITEKGSIEHVYHGNRKLYESSDFTASAFESFTNLMSYTDDDSSYGPSSIDCDRGASPSFFKFGGQHVGRVNHSVQAVTFESPCFDYNEISLQITSENSYSIVHRTVGHKYFTCGDAYLYADLYNYHVGANYWDGDHIIEFHDVHIEEMESVLKHGVYSFRMCDKIINIIPDIIMTMGLLLTDLQINLPFNMAPNIQKDLSWKFIYNVMGYELKERENQENIWLDPKDVRSGDMFGMLSGSGLSTLIQWGTGSFIDHCVTALWMDGVLYVLETNQFGVQQVEFLRWFDYNKHNNMLYLPLKQEYADRLNETAAREYFESIKGHPYGYETFLYAWIDTKENNFPSVLDPYMLAPIFAILEDMVPEAAILLKPGLLKRIGVEDNLRFGQIADILSDRGLEFPDVFPIPEQDDWIYDGHVSYVCSGFVASIWKAGGLFDPYEVNVAEFTPKDVYELALIDPYKSLPAKCNEVNPGKNICQLSGKYEMRIDRVGTVEPYDHMNENCPTVAPRYFRPDEC